MLMSEKLLSHVLISEQQFLIFYNEMLTIETAVSSANLWNSHFHKPWGLSSSSCFAGTMFLFKFCWNNEGETRTAASLQTNGTIQGPAVLYNLLGQCFHMLMSEQQFLIFYNEMLTIGTAVSNANLWNSRFHKLWGESSSPCFATAAVHFNFAGRASGKQGRQFLYKLMTQGKDRSPLQFSGTAIPYAYEWTAVHHILQWDAHHRHHNLKCLFV